MNILYVTVIIAFAVNIVANFENLMVANTENKMISEEHVKDYYMTREIARVTLRAIDIARLGACPSGTQAININGFPNTCWPENAGNSNCFSIGENTAGLPPKTICISNNQSLSMRSEFNNKYNIASFLLNLGVKKANAVFGCPGAAYCDQGGNPNDQGGYQGGENGQGGGDVGAEVVYGNATNYGDPSGFGTYNGMPARSIMTSGDASSSKGSVDVNILPTDNGTNLDTNFINCSATHTECYTLTFCLNGSPSCLVKDRLQQTFAVRKF